MKAERAEACIKAISALEAVIVVCPRPEPLAHNSA